MKIFHRKLLGPKLLLALVPASLVLASCGTEDLEAAKSFGALSQGLAAANQTISADIYGSCTRAATWKSWGHQGNRDIMYKNLKNCDSQYRTNAVNTEIAGSVLVNYVRAIGNLATEDEQGFTVQFNAISEALGTLNIDGVTINENARKAGVQVANFIANFLVRDFRRDNLKSAIVCTDPDIQAYAANLSAFIDSSYVKFLLNKEIETINENFAFYIIDSNEKRRSLEQKERAEINKVIKRKNQGAAYVTAIRSTADFHNKLKQIFNNNQDGLSPELVRNCNQYRSDNENLNVQNNDVTEDSWDLQISASELKQIQNVSKEYIAQITPLLAQIQE